MTLPIPAGARWYKFDLHSHTPASDDYGKGPRQADLKNRSPREWLLDYMRAGIDCVAVTDHNTGGWIDLLKEALEKLCAENPRDPDYRKLWLIPGVEISAQGGQRTVHILGIFPTDATTESITEILGGLKYASGKSPNHQKMAGVGALDVCNHISEGGGIPIPAHTDASNGLFVELGGANLDQFLDRSHIFAVEMLDKGKSKPQIYVNRNKKWTEIIGSDAHHPTGSLGENYPGSRWTWIKMGPQPSLEGLRLALLDGDPLSVRRSDEEVEAPAAKSLILHDSSRNADPNQWAENTIESLSVKEAQFCGRDKPLEIAWSPWLNCIVGGRGSGKSTLVELSRLVLRRTEELSGDPKESFARFSQTYDRSKRAGALTASTEIRLIYRRGDARFRLSWRQDAKGNQIEEYENGEWKSVPGDILDRFPVRIYSQKQVFELSRDPAGLLRIIDDTPDVGKSEWEARWRQEEANFFQLRAQARQIEASFNEESRLRGQLDDIRRKLEVFAREGFSDILQKYQVARRQTRSVEEYGSILGPFGDAIRQAENNIDIPELEADAFSATPEHLEELQAIAAKVRGEIEKIKLELSKLAGNANLLAEGWKLSIARSGWQKATAEAEQKFENLKIELAAVGTSDPNEYGRLVQQRQVLESDLKKIEARRQQLESVNNQALESYAKLLGMRKELTRRRANYLEKTLSRNRFVRMAVTPYGDFAVVEDQFRSIIGKDRPTFAKDILDEDTDQSTGLIADLYRSYLDSGTPDTSSFESKLDDLKQKLANTTTSKVLEGAKDQRFINHIAAMRPEQIDRLWAWWPEDSLRVEYSDGGEWRSISEGSPGQKTAAMLAFLLSRGSEPMILDQPEDDLDNYLIYDLIVRQIRENKQRRQLLIVTHNPNIVVNGDAELVVAMDYRGGQCIVSTEGCLQESEVREEVCRVMEGGREAFEQRYKRVVLESRDVRFG